MTVEIQDKSVRKRRIPTGIWIFALFFVLFFLGSRFSLDGYELEYVLSAMNVYHGGGPQLAPGFHDCPGIGSTITVDPIYPRQNFLQTYLSVPFYALGACLFGESPTIGGQGNFWNLPWGPVLAVSFLNPLLSAGLVILVMFLARLYDVSRAGSYRLAVLFGLSTMIWPYAGMGMEVVQTFFLTLTLLFTLYFQRSGKLWHLAAASLSIILLLNTKKSSFVFILPIVIYLGMSLQEKLKLKKRVVIPAVLMVSLIGFVLLMGSLLIKYQSNPDFFEHYMTKITVGGPSIFDFVFGLLVSPGEGLFIFNPILLLAVPAWGLFYKEYRRDALYFLGVVLVLVIALARVPYILMDEEWGPRYLHAILPILFVAGSAGILKRRTGLKKAVVRSIVVVSILIQALGTLFLGFKVVTAPLDMGVADYHTVTFTPSLSQIYLSGQCFLSTFSRYFTGESLVLEHAVYSHYVGWQPEVEFIEISLATYDQPAGALFTSRWVRAMMGLDVMPEQWIFLINLALMIFLITLLLRVSGIITVHFRLESLREGNDS